MVINGIERGMLYTVGASLMIAKLLPGNSFARITEISEDEVKMDNFIIETAIILNLNYERRKALDNEDYEISVLTREDFLWLSMSEFKEISAEVFKVLNDDAEPTIETKETKSKKNKGKSS